MKVTQSHSMEGVTKTSGRRSHRVIWKSHRVSAWKVSRKQVDESPTESYESHTEYQQSGNRNIHIQIGPCLPIWERLHTTCADEHNHRISNGLTTRAYCWKKDSWVCGMVKLSLPNVQARCKWMIKNYINDIKRVNLFFQRRDDINRAFVNSAWTLKYRYINRFSLFHSVHFLKKGQIYRAECMPCNTFLTLAWGRDNSHKGKIWFWIKKHFP